MNTSISKSTPYGGGVNPAIITFVTAYVRKYWRKSPSEATQIQRTIIVAYLCIIRGLTQSLAAGYLRVSLRTVQRDYSTAFIYYNKVYSFTSQVNNLRGYVEYYQNYCQK